MAVKPFGHISATAILPNQTRRGHRSAPKTSAEHRELDRVEAKRMAEKWDFEKFCKTQCRSFAGKLNGSYGRIMDARYGDAEGGDMQLAQHRK